METLICPSCGNEITENQLSEGCPRCGFRESDIKENDENDKLNDENDKLNDEND